MLAAVDGVQASVRPCSEEAWTRHEHTELLAVADVLRGARSGDSADAVAVAAVNMEAADEVHVTGTAKGIDWERTRAWEEDSLGLDSGRHRDTGV